MIEVKNINKSYSQKSVLENVSLRLKKGEMISFIGANGAGKSTLLSIISRLISKDKGEVYIDDKAVDKWDKNQLSKTISILRQSNYMNIKLTVKELVSFGRFPYSQGNLTSEDLEHIHKAMDYINISHLKDRYIDELSGGERQMAYIAMVIAQDTEYIFLDEPLNNLDMKHSVEIMKILRRLVDELNKTIIIVIHDINFASCYSDYIVALKHGKVVKEGKTKEIIKPEVLKEIYDLDINIEEINGNNLCHYFS